MSFHDNDPDNVGFNYSQKRRRFRKRFDKTHWRTAGVNPGNPGTGFSLTPAKNSGGTGTAGLATLRNVASLAAQGPTILQAFSADTAVEMGVRIDQPFELMIPVYCTENPETADCIRKVFGEDATDLCGTEGADPVLNFISGGTQMMTPQLYKFGQTVIEFYNAKDSIKNLEETLVRLTEERAALDEQLAAKNKDLKSLTSQRDEASSNVQEHEATIKNLNATISKIQFNIEAFEQEAKDEKCGTPEASEKCESISQSLISEQKSLIEEENKLEALFEVLEASMKLLEAKQKEVSALSSEVKLLEKQVAETIESMDRSKDAVDDMRDLSEDLEDDYQDQRGCYNTVVKEMLQLYQQNSPTPFRITGPFLDNLVNQTMIAWKTFDEATNNAYSPEEEENI